jgi:hypothetical protein
VSRWEKVIIDFASLRIGSAPISCAALVASIALSLVSSICHAGVIAKDDRLPIAQFATKFGKTEAEVRKMFAASGRIMCPFNEGTAFLVHQGDIIVTARHNIFPENSMVKHAGRVSLGIAPSKSRMEKHRRGTTWT